MRTLEINTNGSWRTVVPDVPAEAEADVLRACVAITNASVAPGKSRAYGVTWRLRDGDKGLMRLAYSTGEDGKPNTAWSAW